MYWTTKVDGAGRKLSGAHDYLLHFPPRGLPPNSAVWSLTMGDAKNHFVPTPLDRYSVRDRLPRPEHQRFGRVHGCAAHRGSADHQGRGARGRSSRLDPRRSFLDQFQFDSMDALHFVQTVSAASGIDIAEDAYRTRGP
jgi:Protein of unknown function (DUF1214)